ncbi:MAG: M55 family metallopeptidase [Fimbriimonadaceae bacterium]|nr:M55 family metallopeptidase [Fimbriimonadaceae bacterium]
MRYYVLTDLEGPWGVNRWEQTRVADWTPAKRQAAQFLTAEVNAAVAGLLAADPAADIVVLDGHGSGGIDEPSLDERVSLLAHGVGLRSPYGLDGGFDALLFVGQHAMAGTPCAPLCHTFSSKTVEFYRINGEPIGEFGWHALQAGLLGFPTIFLSGDDRACAEASALIPDIVTVPTKLGLGVELALHRPRAQVLAEIESGCAAAVERRASIAPYRQPGPYTFTARMLPGCSIAGWLAKSPAVKQLDEQTIEWTVDDFFAILR